METDIGRRLYKLLHSSSKPKITTVNEAAIPDECRVIHGHFRPDHFRETITDARIVTVIRDPLERSISHYRYLKDHSKVMPIDPEYFTTGMSFQDFAQLPYQQNFQANYLQGESLSIFDTVGVVDELACYCARFDPNGNVEVSRLNTTEGEVFIPENFKEKFFQLNLRDYELYSEAARKNLLP